MRHSDEIRVGTHFPRWCLPLFVGKKQHVGWCTFHAKPHHDNPMPPPLLPTIDFHTTQQSSPFWDEIHIKNMKPKCDPRRIVTARNCGRKETHIWKTEKTLSQTLGMNFYFFIFVEMFRLHLRCPPTQHWYKLSFSRTFLAVFAIQKVE